MTGDPKDGVWMGIGDSAQTYYLNAIGIARRLGIASWPSRESLTKQIGGDAELQRVLDSGLFTEEPDGTIKVAGIMGRTLSGQWPVDENGVRTVG